MFDTFSYLPEFQNWTPCKFQRIASGIYFIGSELWRSSIDWDGDARSRDLPRLEDRAEEIHRLVWIEDLVALSREKVGFEKKLGN